MYLYFQTFQKAFSGIFFTYFLLYQYNLILIFQGEYYNMTEPVTVPSVLPRHEDTYVLPQYGSFLMSNTGAYGGWVASAQDLLKIMGFLERQFKVLTIYI